MVPPSAPPPPPEKASQKRRTQLGLTGAPLSRVSVSSPKGALRSPMTVPADSQYDNTEGRFNIFKEAVIHIREKKKKHHWVIHPLSERAFPILLIQDSISVSTLVGWLLWTPVSVDFSFLRAVGTYSIHLGRRPRFLVIWFCGTWRCFTLCVSSFAMVRVWGSIGGTGYWSKGEEILVLGECSSRLSSLLSQSLG